MIQPNKMSNLDSNQALFKNLIEEIDDYAIIKLDLEGNVEIWNKGAEKIKGYSADEIIGQNFKIFYTDEDRNNNRPERLIKKAIATGKASDEGWRVKKNGEKFWAFVIITAIHDEHGNIIGFSKVTRDLTERLNAENQIKKTHEKLVEVSKQAGVAETASGILHNVGNCLNSVNISSQIIKDFINKIKLEHIDGLLKVDVTSLTGDNIENYMNYINSIKNNIKTNKDKISSEIDVLNNNIAHIKSVITMQQSFAKRIMVNEKIDINSLVDELYTFHATRLKRHDIDIEETLASELPKIYTDKQSIAVIFSNLFINAIDAISDAQRLSNYQSTQSTIKIKTGLIEESEKVFISIEDSGIGFDNDQKKSLFKFGYTTKDKGHGFGLHSCCDIADFLGGEITASSEGPLKGAIFTITLPISANAE